ncbi:MAG: EAL domain-containing protein, partial [Acinetobacter sp.]|nr:EAL domain-containing protein [Acinetobacter sp.]
GQNLQTILMHSDMAMRFTKQQGRNTYHLYDANIQYTSHNHVSLDLLNDLYTALEQQQFQLYYQAKFRLNHEQPSVCGIETLLRWQHPTHGTLLPKDFIATTEQTGLIIPISYWLIEQVCQQIQQWRDSELTSLLPISVNISNLVFEQDDFVHKVKQLVQRYHIQTGELIFEITESVAIKNLGRNAEICKQLHDLGILISMDDFGVGYSNFLYLQDLMIDELKIDRIFLHNILHKQQSPAILQHMIQLAEQLGLQCTVEGVETAEQLAMLKQMNCPNVQGFYLAPPMPLEQLMELLQVKSSQVS